MVNTSHNALDLQIECLSISHSMFLAMLRMLIVLSFLSLFSLILVCYILFDT